MVGGGAAIATTPAKARAKAEDKALDKAERRCERRDAGVIVHDMHTFVNRDGRLHAAEANLIYNCTND